MKCRMHGLVVNHQLICLMSLVRRPTKPTLVTCTIRFTCLKSSDVAFNVHYTSVFVFFFFSSFYLELVVRCCYCCGEINLLFMADTGEKWKFEKSHMMMTIVPQVTRCNNMAKVATTGCTNLLGSWTRLCPM